MKKFAVLLIAIMGIVVSIADVSIAEVGTNVNANISGSAHWTKTGSPYHLKQQIYVLPGATLTIDAGVVVASYVADQGSLAVCRGAQIFVNGTKCEPVIMTSAEDVATWAGSSVRRGDPNNTVVEIIGMGDPKSGVWREGCNEWGNLTIMGDALISASHYGGVPVGTNTKCPDGTNQKQMEGLTDPVNGMYGGDNDDDDSGEIHYLSIRYGGKVVGLANELNGLSLGGIGRNTEIDHVEIMNNVDDGIEIWGGTVCLSHINIWNVGDDSFDVDEGWRGSTKYGLIVQGYSINASQGSGVGDNCIETDGAEDSDAQPVTTAAVSNYTIIGQPWQSGGNGGDHGTAWRDNARVQYTNCIWMDLGEKLVAFDNTDGDGANGYGYNGTLSWADTWKTSYNQWIGMAQSGINLCGEDLSAIYAQYMCCPADANLACIKDSVFYNNVNAAAYTEADARGVRNPANNNVTASSLPIQAITRGSAVVKGGKTMLPVISINPCAANDAVHSVNQTPDCECFTSSNFRGGFNTCDNWLESWSAVDAYGMLISGQECDKTDFDGDGDTDMRDFADFANGWLM